MELTSVRLMLISIAKPWEESAEFAFACRKIKMRIRISTLHINMNTFMIESVIKKYVLTVFTSKKTINAIIGTVQTIQNFKVQSIKWKHMK